MGKKSKKAGKKHGSGRQAPRPGQYSSCGPASFNTDVDAMVKAIQRGDDLKTQQVNLIKSTQADIAFRAKLVHAGMVDAVLDHLQDCTKPFLEYLMDIGANAAAPSVWTNCVVNTVAKDQLPPALLKQTRHLIYQRLTNLVDTMTDPKQEFFGNHRYWLMGLPVFVALLNNLTLDEELAEIIILHDKIPAFVVQAVCLSSQRPDLWGELIQLRREGVPLPIELIGISGAGALQDLTHAVEYTNAAETGVADTPSGRKRLQKLAQMNCVLPSEGETHESKPFLPTFLQHHFTDLCDAYPDASRFIMKQFIISDLARTPAAIRSLVTVGKKRFDFTPTLLYWILINEESQNPNDEKYAIAIKAGLFEMCLAQAGESQVKDIVLAASAVALGRKCSKVLSEMSGQLQELVRTYPHRGPAEQEILELIKQVLHKARMADSRDESIVSGRSMACRWCHKMTRGKEVKRCSQCKRAVYCGRDCQALDWKEGGHKKECKFMRTADLREQARGQPKKDVKAAGRLEKNISIGGNEIFQRNYQKVLMQATLKKLSILDCVTVIDLSATPTSLEVVLGSDWLQQHFADDAAAQAHNKLIVERNRKNGALTVACASIIHVDDRLGSAGQSVLMKTYPSFPGQPAWDEMQNDIASRMGFSDIDLDNPEVLAAVLQDCQVDGGGPGMF